MTMSEIKPSNWRVLDNLFEARDLESIKIIYNIDI